MGNHHFLWEYLLFKWPFWIAMLVITRGYPWTLMCFAHWRWNMDTSHNLRTLRDSQWVARPRHIYIRLLYAWSCCSATVEVYTWFICLIHNIYVIYTCYCCIFICLIHDIHVAVLLFLLRCFLRLNPHYFCGETETKKKKKNIAGWSRHGS